MPIVEALESVGIVIAVFFGVCALVAGSQSLRRLADAAEQHQKDVAKGLEDQNEFHKRIENKRAWSLED